MQLRHSCNWVTPYVIAFPDGKLTDAARKDRSAVLRRTRHRRRSRSSTSDTLPMLTLYDYLPSQNAYKVRLLLHHLGLPYRTELISIFEGDGQRPDYLAINPTGAVPAIRL